MVDAVQGLKPARPRLAVVVAAHNARASIEDCLASLVTQCRAQVEKYAVEQDVEQAVEIVVVDNSTDGTTEIIKRYLHDLHDLHDFPDIRLISQPPSALIPELWAVGIQHTTATIVAITTAHCIPQKDWLSHICDTHSGPYPAVGGAIENDPRADLIDSAVYFCRYSRYMLPFAESRVGDIPGDNASYKRSFLERCESIWQHGFWEPAVHAELHKMGAELVLVPSIVVSHRRSFRFWEFVCQRFQHGHQFGTWRASCLTRSECGLYALLSPAIPFVLLGRIGRQVLGKPRHWLAFSLGLPVLSIFLLAWASGECKGYVRGLRG